MNKLSYIFIFVASISFRISAQHFSVQDIEIGRKSYLSPQTFENLQWKGNSGTLIYTANKSIYEINTKDYKTKNILSLDKLNQIVISKGLDSISDFPALTFHSENEYSFIVREGMVLCNLKNQAITAFYPLPGTAENMEFNYKPGIIAYTLGNNIWIEDKTGNKFQVTHDSTDGIVNGDTVYRNEFGMDKGIYWSPQGNYFAFYRKDESKVTKYPLMDINHRVAQLKDIRYPMAGMESEETEVWIFSIIDHSLIKLSIEGDPEQYHTNLSWSTDEQAIYLQHLNRDQNLMILKSYSAKTGKFIKQFFTESDEHYVEPLNPLVFSQKNSENFYYQSRRDGFNHIYYYDKAKDSLAQLTKGNWEVTEFKGFGASERYFYFMATKDSPLERQLYKLNRSNGTIVKLTKEQGTHEIILSSDKSLFIDTYSSNTVPQKIVVGNSRGEIEKVILNVPNPIEDYSLGQVETGTIKAADDTTDLYYRLVKPVDFDPAKKYPVLIYVYGGPHVQLITNSWMDRIDYFQQYMAQRGYISFTLDCRGSEGRGRAFEDIIHRNTGIPQLEDQYRGVCFLGSLTYADTARIGVHGWSYGGYMAISMMLHYPGIYKVGVAGGPIIDWKLYEVMYGERYMDKPEENKEGYDLTNLNNYAGNLQGKLLIINGALDPVVIGQNSLTFLEACIKNGKQVDYFVYPLQEHKVQGPDRVHLTTMISEYFLRNL
jgi:dipeptidyl-peptidase-4